MLIFFKQNNSIAVLICEAPMGFEPMTSYLLDRRSNQLSYGAFVAVNFLNQASLIGINFICVMTFRIATILETNASIYTVSFVIYSINGILWEESLSHRNSWRHLPFSPGNFKMEIILFCNVWILVSLYTGSLLNYLCVFLCFLFSCVPDLNI